MNKIFLVNLFSIFISIPSLAQRPIVESVINNIRSQKSLSFHKFSISKNPFSAGDTTVANTTAMVIFDSLGNVMSASETTTINNGQSQLRDVFFQDSLHSFDLLDSTYTVANYNKKNFQSGFSYIADHLTNQLNTNASKIVMKHDTLINDILCYNFFINSYDTVIKDSRNYTHKQLLVDKATLNPIYFKEVGEGIMEKGGYVIGRVQIYNEARFNNVSVNAEIPPSAFNSSRTGFTSPNSTMLTLGTIAPPLDLKDLAKKSVSNSRFKNKITLIEFGGIACPANPLAHPMLNRLHQKYNSTDVAIVSIYTDETSDQLNKYVATNGLLFPVYLGTRQNKKAFSTLGTPNFYLLDKKGIIIESIVGYSHDLEEKLERQIINLLSAK